MPDPHATDRSAPASPLPPVAGEGKGAENGRGPCEARMLPRRRLCGAQGYATITSQTGAQKRVCCDHYESWVALASAADLMWLCRDFAFTHPEHAGRRSSMPLAFIAMGDRATAGLDRLARSGRHPGALVVGA